MRILLLLGAAVAVAACGSQPAADVAPQGNLAEPRNVAAAPEPVAAEKVAEVQSGPAAIPAALRGRWGLEEKDCTSAPGTTTGLLRIAERELQFFESRGELVEVVESGPTNILADYRFAGEGETWRQRVLLEEQDGMLVRREPGNDAMPGAVRYRKCAGA